MAISPFLDSNILVYAYGKDPRTPAAQTLCQQPYVISVQSLNEFANVSRRKIGYDWEHIKTYLEAILELAEQVVPLATELHANGVAIAERYILQTYDAMIIAAALEAGCDTLYSEDMQNGLVIEDQLTIHNPFA